MLAQRLRRWPNNKTSLFQHVVFAEKRARDIGLTLVRLYLLFGASFKTIENAGSG